MAVVMRGIVRKCTSKMRNRKVELDGYVFDSIRESERYKELRLKEKARLIFRLEVHPIFKLAVNDIHICNYEPDSSYQELSKDGEESHLVVEDVKSKTDTKPRFIIGRDGKLKRKKKFSTRTEGYRIKKRLMKAVLGIEIREI